MTLYPILYILKSSVVENDILLYDIIKRYYYVLRIIN